MIFPKPTSIIDLYPGEKVEHVFRKHWIVCLTSILTFILFIFLYFLLSYLLPKEGDFLPFYTLIRYICIFFLLNFALISFLDYYLDIVILTNERIVEVEQKVLFGRSISELHLIDIQDVTSQTKGFLETLFNFGTVSVQTAGTTRYFVFKHLSNPRFIAQKITTLKANLKKPEKPPSKKIGEMLIEENLVTEEQLERALKKQKEKGGRLGSHLIDMGLISPEVLLSLLSRQTRFPAIDVSKYEFSSDILKLIPKEIAKKYLVIPLSKFNNVITLAMVDPTDILVIEKIRNITGCEISPVISAEKFIKEVIDKYYK